jgi:hypothetical protein
MNNINKLLQDLFFAEMYNFFVIYSWLDSFSSYYNYPACPVFAKGVEVARLVGVSTYTLCHTLSFTIGAKTRECRQTKIALAVYVFLSTRT